MLSQNSNDLKSSDLQNNAVALNRILEHFRANQQSEREKGTYFEELSMTFFKNDPTYRQLYSDVWTYGDWAAQVGEDKRDTGIDLVAKTHGTEEYHAIQCKFYAQDYRVQKSDIDSFFTASGKKPFTNRIIVTTTNLWGEHAENALSNQQPPVTKIDLAALEQSAIVWANYENRTSPDQAIALKEKKSLRPHQKTALERVKAGLETADRGKLIMACGTGKTFTSLKIAEKLAGKGKRVLFLVPSLSLLRQSLVEWSQESATPLRSFAVCSDTQVGKSREKSEDYVATNAHELQYPATTNAERLAAAVTKSHEAEAMTVVFSTYHSIDTISRAQKEHELAEFDLIVCDEAHRTTGQTFDGDDESNFVKVHDADFIQAKKRLYMTATPRIYGDNAKTKANDESITLCSMDDENLYGKELHVIPFSEAVRLGLLVDYKVIVLSVDERHISARLQNLLADENNSLKVDDAAKIVGCWKALSKQDTQEDLNGDTAPMRRAVAFCQVIEANYKGKAHKVSSKNIANLFSDVVEAYKASELESGEFEEETLPSSLRLSCEAAHVDGSMNATGKEEKLTWLKAETAEDTCRILSNVRCLSEGVDVPALDAVLFLTPRNSEVDVVQSVGRVMRNAPNKKRGYIILPVVIPAGVEPNKALDDNKTYKVVWQVLQALRSHDDRFDAMINKIDLTGTDKSKMEVIAVTDKINSKTKATKKGDGTPVTNKKAGRGGSSIGTVTPVPETGELAFNVGEIEKAIIAKVVKKCGNRFHWEDWANDIAKIAQTHIIRIQTILENAANVEAITAFQAFAHEIRDDLNDSVTDAEIVEMLAQHLITKPVFEALFEGHSFAQQNPMSLAMQSVLAVLEKYHLEKEADTLASFYASVKMRIKGIDSATGKQKIVVELYDKFFTKAFPRLKDKLGIVYTPVQVVDFIIHSVNDILQAEFGQTLGSEGVHIVDPFTGTGTFMTRLLQSGLIAPDRLAAKYASEIHANELVLLAYYIAAINIESVYHDLMAEAQMPVAYTPFSGICLTDTFQLYEKEDLVSQLLVANSGRRKRQKKLDIRVIIGNPPYSSGQTSANDNNANVAYPFLDGRIRDTYAANSKASLQNKLYDSYIRAIRWASDRIKDAGVVGFVTNAGWVDANTADGLRKSLAAEFSSVYVFHLRGNARTSGEQRRKEKDNIFGQGTRTPIAISFLVKNPKATAHGQIHFYDIGDYLSQADKLAKITDLHSMAGITAANLWTRITPDTHGDWINQRDDSFGDHISLGDKKDKNSVTVFENFSLGVATNRDAWVYNASKIKLENNMRRMIDFYNQERERYQQACIDLDKKACPDVTDFLNNDPRKISWTVNLKKDVESLKKLSFVEGVSVSLYRPFSKLNLYFNKQFNERRGQMPHIFPNAAASNRVISMTGRGATKDFCALMTDTLPDLEMISKGQCFPLALHETINIAPPPQTESQLKSRHLPQHDGQQGLFCVDDGSITRPASDRGCAVLSSVPLRGDHSMKTDDLFKTEAENEAVANSETTKELTRKDGITDAGLAHFADFYAPTLAAGQTINKEDLFYYIYGLLHSDDYKSRFADNLTKELPRIPRVKKVADFWHFSQAGRDLADLHVDYESVAMYPVDFAQGNAVVQSLPDSDFYVTNMKFGKASGVDDEGKAIKYDKTRIEYNAKITLTNIPLEAYDYIVNGKSAIEWVMERQGVATHKDSGIINDANDWAIETMGNARYPLELLQRVITVSIETMKIVRALPKLDF